MGSLQDKKCTNHITEIFNKHRQAKQKKKLHIQVLLIST